MDIDGNNQRQLTSGSRKGEPGWSPDSRHIVYTSFGETPSIWVVAAEGGEPRQLTKAIAVGPDISPDGRFVACYYMDEQTSGPKIAVLPFSGGAPEPLNDPHLGPITDFAWAARRKQLVYTRMTRAFDIILLKETKYGS
jgi:hypothetical protein